MITKETTNLRESIQSLLENKDLEVHFRSPSGDYGVIYSTSIVAKEIVEPTTLHRTYWMVDNKIGSEVTSPWDGYEHSKQIDLATNLIKFANYEVIAVYDGWTQTCKKCGTVENGRVWRNITSKCEVVLNGKKCGYKFLSSDAAKIPLEGFESK
jgi:hypothetical protein